MRATAMRSNSVPSGYRSRLVCLLFLLSTAFAAPAAVVAADAPADNLPSWNEGEAKSTIVDFVTRVTSENGADFVAPEERIAVFDNDGTLWTEQPNYFQGMFAVDRVKAMAPEHPEWKDKEPFASLLKGDMAAVAASGEKASSNS